MDHLTERADIYIIDRGGFLECVDDKPVHLSLG